MRVESRIIFNAIPKKNQSQEIKEWIDGEVRSGTLFSEIIHICSWKYGLNKNHVVLRTKKAVTDDEISVASKINSDYFSTLKNREVE